jgi:hypothetical protein
VIRRARPLLVVLAALIAMAGAVACGIDEDEVTQVTLVDQSDTTSTEPTSTTEGGPEISLPDIPSDVTEPESTVPDPTEPDTLPEGEATPGGFTPDGIRDALLEGTDLTEEQATCVSIGVFASLDGSQIDELFTADDTSEVDPDVVSQFEEIVLTCVQGG